MRQIMMLAGNHPDRERYTALVSGGRPTVLVPCPYWDVTPMLWKVRIRLPLALVAHFSTFYWWWYVATPEPISHYYLAQR